MSHAINLHRITRALSDGTGLTQEEVWLFGAAAVLSAVLSGLLWAMNAVLWVADAVNRPSS